MLLVLQPVLLVVGEQVRCAADDEQILGIRFLRGLGEVQGTGDECFTVDDHDLVMSFGVFPVRDECVAPSCFC